MQHRESTRVAVNTYGWAFLVQIGKGCAAEETLSHCSKRSHLKTFNSFVWFVRKTTTRTALTVIFFENRSRKKKKKKKKKKNKYLSIESRLGTVHVLPHRPKNNQKNTSNLQLVDLQISICVACEVLLLKDDET
jgi:hypothetical protein